MRAVLPLLLGVIPLGTISGVLALAAGMPPAAAQVMSAVVFAGSAQFVAVQLISAGTPAIVVLLTTFVINLRHVLYSAPFIALVVPTLNSGAAVAAAATAGLIAVLAAGLPFKLGLMLAACCGILAGLIAERRA